MKHLFFTIIVSLFAVFVQAQNQNETSSDTLYKITQNDGTELLGYILEKNAREVTIKTNDGRDVIIPQYVINKIEVVKSADFNEKGVYIGEDKFATRYFITTNGLPIKKGEHYIQWNLFGPDMQFAVADNLGVGVMTSWVGIPLIGSIKYSTQVNENTHFATGALVGYGSWAAPLTGGALPFATLSFGDRSKNIAITGGYLAVADGWGIFNSNQNGFYGAALASVAGMVKVSPKISIVFDSFIVPPQGEKITRTYPTWNGPDVTETYRETRGGALLIPGIRWHQSEGKSLQFGFAGLIDGYGDILPVPIPMVQWFRSI